MQNRCFDDIAAVIKSHEGLIQRIPHAEKASDEFIKEEAKNHFISFHDEDEEDENSPEQENHSGEQQDAAPDPAVDDEEEQKEQENPEPEKAPGNYAEI